MNQLPILAGTAIVGLIYQAEAVPVPFTIEAVSHSEVANLYTTKATPVGPDILAALIPYRLLKNDKVTYHLRDKDKTALKIWAQEKLTGLTLFKVDKSYIRNTQTLLAPSNSLRRGQALFFPDSKNKSTQGVYIGMEHAIGNNSFPLRLIRAQFPKHAIPTIGQPCYDKEDRLAGLVLGVSPKGTCHLLPAKAISFLATNPNAKRVRLGCLLDVNASTPIIEGIINNGPLARGGIQSGDILISINGNPIHNYGDMLDTTYYLTGDKNLTIEVIRGTQVINCKDISPTQDSR